MTMEELDRELEKSYKKQRIALRVGGIAAIGSVICTIVVLMCQISG